MRKENAMSLGIGCYATKTFKLINRLFGLFIIIIDKLNAKANILMCFACDVYQMRRLTINTSVLVDFVHPSGVSKLALT